MVRFTSVVCQLRDDRTRVDREGLRAEVRQNLRGETPHAALRVAEPLRHLPRVTYGYRLQHLWLQAPAPKVTGSATYG